MAYTKLALFSLFLLAMFLMKTGEAARCSGTCNPFQPQPCRPIQCRCISTGISTGHCRDPYSESTMKMVEEHPNICQSHADCTKKGSGSFCARYPNPCVEHGWCFVSNTEAENFFKAVYNAKENGLLKMNATAAT